MPSVIAPVSAAHPAPRGAFRDQAPPIVAFDQLAHTNAPKWHKNDVAWQRRQAYAIGPGVAKANPTSPLWAAHIVEPTARP